MAATLVIGILTGLVSGALFLSAKTGSVLGVLVLMLLSPLPVAISGLGWNIRAAIVAVITGAFVVAVAAGDKVQGPLVYVLSYAGPAAVLAHMSLLARPVASAAGGEPHLEWFPLGRILAGIGLWAGVITAISMTVLLWDRPETIGKMRTMVEQLNRQGWSIDGTPGQATPEKIDRFVELMLVVLPVFFAFFWVAVTTLNIWLAAHTVRAAGRLKRPWPDLGATALPVWLSLVLAMGLAVSFAGGALGIVGGAMAAGCLAAYTLGGLAILHHITRGLTGRSLLLAGTYLAMVVVSPLAVPAIALIALAEPILSTNRRGPLPPPQGP